MQYIPDTASCRKILIFLKNVRKKVLYSLGRLQRSRGPSEIRYLHGQQQLQQVCLLYPEQLVL